MRLSCREIQPNQKISPRFSAHTNKKKNPRRAVKPDGVLCSRSEGTRRAVLAPDGRGSYSPPHPDRDRSLRLFAVAKDFLATRTRLLPFGNQDQQDIGEALGTPIPRASGTCITWGTQNRAVVHQRTEDFACCSLRRRSGLAALALGRLYRSCARSILCPHGALRRRCEMIGTFLPSTVKSF